jgi:fumarylacetoacetase
MSLDETHDPALTSWVDSANAPACDFPIQNLPFGVFREAGTSERFRPGVAIGNMILDLPGALAAGVFTGDARTAAEACAPGRLNGLMALGPRYWSALRLALSRMLRTGAKEADALRAHLVPQGDVEYDLPATIGDYTDFYASVHHATSVGALFRPDNPLLPNYKWIPIAYHGRSSSIRVSGQRFVRPSGQLKGPNDAAPRFAPSQRLDYELEMGVFVGPGNALGTPIPLAEAEQHAFGMVLLNDWSARDIQAWEYQPLGPFLAKNFASTISPWVVTMAALAPYRTAWTRPAEDPQPLPYLESADNRATGAIDIALEAYLQTERMRHASAEPQRLSRSSFRHAYWTIAQMIAHHASNGCNLMPGDLLGTGTQSGPTEPEAGSLLELTKGGKQPLTLPAGETRTFLADGDTLILRAHCEAPGRARIGFGECRATVLPAVG